MARIRYNNGMWNYRVVKDKDGFSFREVWYEKGKPVAWTSVPCEAYGATEEDFAHDLALMAKTLGKPILEETSDVPPKLVEYKHKP